MFAMCMTVILLYLKVMKLMFEICMTVLLLLYLKVMKLMFVMCMTVLLLYL